MEPPFDLNALTHIWRTINAFQVLTHSFPKYLKLVKMAIVHILGNVEDKRHFSILAFLKNKLQVTLDPHLPLVVGMHCQIFYTLKTFPYAIPFDAWIGVANHYGGIV